MEIVKTYEIDVQGIGKVTLKANPGKEGRKQLKTLSKEYEDRRSDIEKKQELSRSLSVKAEDLRDSISDVQKMIDICTDSEILEKHIKNKKSDREELRKCENQLSGIEMDNESLSEILEAMAQKRFEVLIDGENKEAVRSAIEENSSFYLFMQMIEKEVIECELDEKKQKESSTTSGKK